MLPFRRINNLNILDIGKQKNEENKLKFQVKQIDRLKFLMPLNTSPPNPIRFKKVEDE